MAETTVTTPYASAVAYVAGDLPGWVDEYSAQRLATYDLYDDLYDNVPAKALAMLRGQDDKPIFIPSAKRLVKTMCRYIGKDWGYVVELAAPTSEGTPAATPEAELAVKEALGNLFRRESVLSQFTTGKADLLRRGDWIWMVSADPAKPQGKRISLTTVDPRTYFPIHDEADLTRLSGCQIAEEHLLEDGSTIAIKVQTWLKPNHPEHPSYGEVPPEEGFPIAYMEEVLELANWYAEKTVLQVTTPLEELPGIYALPLYHVKIGTSDVDPFGRSILAGLESIIMGINQAVSDEDVSLALAGVGMFTTDAAPPVNDEGEVVDWQFGPGRVIERAKGTTFDRLQGIDDVTPWQDHLKYLSEQFYGSVGVNDIALGRAGSAAESGVALAIKMQPLFDEADDIDEAINGKWSQMLYDLVNMWFPVYEQMSFTGVEVYAECANDGRLPFDREQRWKELVDGFTAGFFTIAYVHKVLNEELGYDLTSEEANAVMAEAQAKADAVDPYASRARAELGA